MSGWLGTLTSNMESLLERVDQVAGQALLKDEDTEELSSRGLYFLPESEWDVPPPPPSSTAVTTSHYAAFPGSSGSAALGGAPSQFSPFQVVGGRSVAQSLIGSERTQKLLTSTELSSTTASKPVTPGRVAVKDPDQELFEFLNSPASPPLVESGAGSVTDGSVTGSAHMSRSPSTSSTLSSRSRRTPEGGHETLPTSSTAPSGNLLSDPPRIISRGGDDDADNNTSSTALKTQVGAMNRDMTSLLRQLQATQDELGLCQRQLDSQRRQLLLAESAAGELKRRDADCREALAAKDAQIGVLRTRLDEADHELELRARQLGQLSHTQDRLQMEQSSSSGIQRQTVDSLQEKLSDLEMTLGRERDEHRRLSDESTRHHSRLEADKQSLMLEISSLQKSVNRERARCSELSSQLKLSRSQAESAKQELSDYKDKALRILQSKEKLIVSLKDGTAAGKCSGAELAVLVSELESSRQERDVVREQLQTTQLALDSLHAEMTELEGQLQHDAESSRDQIASLEDQLRAERRRREDVEFDINKHKQELRSMHDELVKQKTGFVSRLQSRDDEIGRLRSQLVAKSMNASNQEELENRLRTLTESLIQKQTTLESLSTEKNSLLLQLERMERQYREAETSALRAASTNVNILSTNDDNDEVRQRLPGFMSQSPLDGNVTRRVKMAAGIIDRLGIHLGLFLRRYPIARVLVVLYMFVLHLWVMIVMLTYQPETHISDFAPAAAAAAAAHRQQQQQAALPLPPS